MVRIRIQSKTLTFPAGVALRIHDTGDLLVLNHRDEIIGAAASETWQDAQVVTGLQALETA